MLHLLFYIFATAAVLSATVVIAVRNPVRSVLALVVTFFSMAGIWMLFTAEFLSLILLLVYVGAVMTLFLFVVMMLNVDVSSQRPNFTRYLPFGVAIVLLMIGILITAMGTKFQSLLMPPQPGANYSNITQLGMLLYTEYAYPFEIAGVLLLAGIVAAINLAHHRPRGRKSQDIDKQLNVRPEERVSLVKMPSERKLK